jgi:adenylate kinase
VKTRITLLGPPASGKGTQADLLATRLGFPVISTGNLLRAEIAAETELGRQAGALIHEGNLVPDEMILKMIETHTRGDKFLFDGFPRTLPQARALDDLLQKRKGAPLDAAIHLDLPEDIIRKRVLNRVICPSCHFVGTLGDNLPADATQCPRCSTPLTRREDDTEEVLAHRLLQYREKTAPILPYYQERGLLHSIDAGVGREKVFAAIGEILGVDNPRNLTKEAHS